MKKKYIIVSIISVLIMMIGFSFAYFTSNVNGIGKEMNVSSKRLAIIFTDTKEIVGEDINPGWNTSKTFTVENKSGGVFYYDINIDDLINTFVTTGYLQYKITSADGGYNMGEYVDIPKSEEARREKLASNIEIENGSVHTYTIEFKYPNDLNVNQSDDMGKELSGSLSITESNIVVVKYKVNNVIQDTIPDKTEPYIVDKVTCSNNAKGTWNEITEKVDLIGEVTQTVCIVEFKEGNTVNIITENNEVVSPVSKVVGRIGSATFEIEQREGYEIENARVTCDNGALGSVTGNTITITNITKDNTCRVVTNPKTIIVTYNANGGSGVSPTNNTVTYAGKYKLPGTNPSRTGYTFVGWFTEASGGTEVTTNTDVTNANDHSIYAHWTPETYTITYNLNSGSISGQKTSYTIETATFTLPTPTRNGYTFTGWTGSNGSTVQTSVTISKGTTGNKTYTANWKQSKVTFTMNSSACPDKVNNNSSPCYIICHAYKCRSTSSADWNGKVTHGGKTYTNCTINDYTIHYSSATVGNCSTGSTTDVVDFTWWNVGSFWGMDGWSNRVYNCSISLICDLT